MNHPRPHPAVTRAASETLEPRRLLAGDVTTSLVGDDLVVTGDAADNRIFVTQQSVGTTTRLVGSGGTTSLNLDTSTLQSAAGLTFISANDTDPTPAASLSLGFNQVGTSTLSYRIDSFDAGDRTVLGQVAGTIRHSGSITLERTGGARFDIGDFDIAYEGGRAGIARADGVTSGWFVRDMRAGLGVLFDLTTVDQYFAQNAELNIEGPGVDGTMQMLVSPEFAQYLLDEGLASSDLTGVDVGDLRVDADSTPVTSDLYRVNSASGSDVANLIDGQSDVVYEADDVFDVVLDGGDGNDELFVASADIPGFLTIRGGAGDDFSRIARMEVDPAIVYEDSADGGTYEVFNTLTGGVIFDGGDGEETLDLRNVTSTGALRLSMNGGNDLFTSTNSRIGTNGTAFIFFRGGDGDDVLRADTTDFGPRPGELAGFEDVRDVTVAAPSPLEPGD